MNFEMPITRDHSLQEIARQMRIANTMNMLRVLLDNYMISDREYRDELEKLRPII